VVKALQHRSGDIDIDSLIFQAWSFDILRLDIGKVEYVFPLSTALNEVLNNPAYRGNARKLQKEIAKTNGLSVAADLIEESLGITKKVGALQV
jgi:hypothetical protein